MTADRITAFAGSMRFVFLSIIWFACWIGFGVEDYPYGLLTMIVSLEAIFLSTFVMISQNRADEKRQVIAKMRTWMKKHVPKGYKESMNWGAITSARGGCEAAMFSKASEPLVRASPSANTSNTGAIATEAMSIRCQRSRNAAISHSSFELQSNQP